MGPYYDIQQVNTHNLHVDDQYKQAQKVQIRLPGPATRFGLSVWLVALITGVMKVY